MINLGADCPPDPPHQREREAQLSALTHNKFILHASLPPGPCDFCAARPFVFASLSHPEAQQMIQFRSLFRIDSGAALTPVVLVVEKGRVLTLFGEAKQRSVADKLERKRAAVNNVT